MNISNKISIHLSLVKTYKHSISLNGQIRELGIVLGLLVGKTLKAQITWKL